VNYKQLVAIHGKYKLQGLSILGFPCNQFGSQEPGTAADIKKFVAKYGVQFDMFEKIRVNGSDTHPVFRYLKANTSSMFGGFLKWNFTKFLVNRAGKPVERYAPSTNPEKILPEIEKLLKEPLPAGMPPSPPVQAAIPLVRTPSGLVAKDGKQPPAKDGKEPAAAAATTPVAATTPTAAAAATAAASSASSSSSSAPAAAPATAAAASSS